MDRDTFAAAMPFERDERGRFTAALGLHQLLDGVAEIARAAADSEEAASLVSKGAWDAARLELGRTDLPRAEAIRKRLRLSWQDVLGAALCAPAERGLYIGHRRSGKQADEGDEIVARALRAVALELGETPTRTTYDATIAVLRARRRRRGLEPIVLPVAATVEARFGSWDAALAAAGLDARPRAAPPRRNARPAAELLDEFISETGLLPPRVWFEAWCRGRGTMIGRDGRKWDRVVAAAAELRRARGEAMPARTATRAELPPLPAEGTRASAKRIGYSREAVLASLRRYGQRHLEAGQQPRQKHYLVCCRRDPELIVPSCFNRHGRFQDLCREAGL